MNDAVRRSVRFRQGNVFDADFLAGAEPYDAIFCRNLLIYFDAADAGPHDRQAARGC